MQLTLDTLNKAGAFTGGPVKKVVKWSQGDEAFEADVWVRPMSYNTAVKDIEAVNKGGDLIAHRIAASICHEDGSPVFNVSDITGYHEDGTPVMVKVGKKDVERGPLNKELSNALILLVSEVSGLGKTKS